MRRARSPQHRRDHAGPHADRADPAEAPERAVLADQPAADQEERLRRDRRGVPPLRPEGVRDLRRPADGAGLRPGREGRPVLRQGRPDHPRQQVGADRQDQGRGQGVRAAVPGRADHRGRALQQGGGQLVALHGRGCRRHDEGDQQAGGGQAHQQRVDDVPFRRAWLAGADAPVGRHARPDGQAVRRDHRAADHRELQGRPDRAGVFQLHPRRPQGPGRHRAEDRELRLPDPAPGGRGAGLHHPRGGLRHRARPDGQAGDGWRRGGGQPVRAHPGPHHGRGRDGPALRRGAGAEQHADRGDAGRADREGRRGAGEDPLRADLRGGGRRVRALLRAGPGARHAGEHRRGGGRDRGAVDRRAGHAAHHAHLPHRRRRPARCRGVQRGGQP